MTNSSISPFKSQRNITVAGHDLAVAKSRHGYHVFNGDVQIQFLPSLAGLAWWINAVEAGA